MNWYRALVILGILSGTPSVAQQALQTVKMHYGDTLAIGELKKLSIYAERAKVVITNWDRPYLSYSIEVSAKHADREIALRDLNYCQLIQERRRKEFFLRNYVELPKSATKPQSDILAIYTIQVPMGMDLHISNYFGKVELSCRNNRVSLNTQFSDIFIEAQRKESVEIKSLFGLIEIDTLHGSFTIDSDRTDIHINHLAESGNIQASVADVRIKKLLGKNITIDGEQIKLELPYTNYLTYQLLLTNSALQMPKSIKSKRDKLSDTTRKISFGEGRNAAEITLHNSKMVVEL